MVIPVKVSKFDRKKDVGELRMTAMFSMPITGKAHKGEPATFIINLETLLAYPSALT
jgi:hypothetical protein